MNDVAPQLQADGTPAAGRRSFRERKMDQLNRERSTKPPETPPQEARQQALDVTHEATQSPSAEPLESQDVPLDPSQEGYADEEDEELEAGALAEDLEGEEDPELPSAEDPEENPESLVDWEKRYKDLQSETQHIRESIGEMEQEQAQSLGGYMEARFELEDMMQQVGQMHEFVYQTLAGNASQFENINWAQVPPDKVQEVQQLAQNALSMKQQAEQAMQQFAAYRSEQIAAVKQREAAVAKVRLKRSIPGWGNDTYHSLREFSRERGLPVEMFNDITHPVLMEALHAYQTLSQGAEGVQNVRTARKPQAPRSKAKRRQARDSRGKFARTQVEPNVKGSFADKHRHRLAMERGA